MKPLAKSLIYSNLQLILATVITSTTCIFRMERVILNKWMLI